MPGTSLIELLSHID